MRRFAPPCLTDSLPLPSSTPSPQWLLELSLPLECITPVLGGGTRSRQPDQKLRQDYYEAFRLTI